MEKEFNLKEKVESGIFHRMVSSIKVSDVKEFIKRREEIIRSFFDFDRKLNRFIFYPEELEDLIKRLNKLTGDL